MDILSPEEKQKLHTGWNDTEIVLKDSCIHKLFEERAAKAPDSAAVIFEGEILTYAELNARANKLAHKLIALGVKPGSIVAIALERSTEMIIALLAVHKAGGAYLPLDPDYPADRLQFMLNDSGSKILVTDTKILERLKATVKYTLCLDEENQEIDNLPSENPGCPVSPQDLAYIIYTSGSTGRPKGVAVEHCSIAYHCSVIQQRYRLTTDDKVLQFASFSFDASVEQILATLISGAALILPAHGVCLLTPDGPARLILKCSLAVKLYRHPLPVK